MIFKKVNSMPSALSRVVKSRLFFALVCLGLVLALDVVVFAITNQQNFFKIELSPANTLTGPLMQILYWAPELVILAMGMTLVASCSAGADISVGSVMVLSGAVGIKILGGNNIENFKVEEYAVPLVLAFGAFIAVGALCGVWNGFLVAKLKVQPMVATLILFIGARAAAKVVTGGTILRVEPKSFRWLGNYITDSEGNNIFPVPTQVFVAIVVVAATALVLRFTALGTNIQSVGINAKASKIMGIRSDRTIWLAFVFCGVCAGIAGIIMTSKISSIDSQWGARMIELDAILAVALGGNSLAGGKFSLAGSVVGAITIQALKTGLLTAGVRAEQMPFYQAIVVVIIVIIQSPELRPMASRTLARMRKFSGKKVVKS
ncbi:MAG: ABC transporter permease [Propionibacteriaceae bacterium]|nr:ABC transporter permease [Propionibacteriaceae bacterium]